MNILTEDLPTKIKIKNKIYDINYDYRTIIKCLQAFEDESLTKTEKIYVMLNNIYKEEIPFEDISEACMKAIKFIDCNQEHRNSSSNRLYSFSQDANYIFSGINQTHNINLQANPKLHWWVFWSLFTDMGTDCTFNQLIYYRTRKAENKLTKEEKKEYQKLKDIIELHDTNYQVNKEARNKFFEELRKGAEKNGK